MNFGGWGDSASLWIADDSTLRFTKAFNLSNGENCRMIIMANDTTNAGLTADTLMGSWGFQTGSIIGRADTVWDVPYRIDTLDLTNKSAIYQYNSLLYVAELALDGTETRAKGMYDTLGGVFAKQSVSVSPPWDVVWRFWFQPLTGSKRGQVIFRVVRRDYVGVRIR